MVKIYVRKILAGELTIDDVPTRWREAVREALDEQRCVSAERTYEGWTRLPLIYLGGQMEIKDEERMATIPLIAHELAMSRLERIIKSLIVIIIILIAIIGFGVYELTYCDFQDITVDSEDGGVANYLNAGANGVINNAEDNRPNEDTQK